MAGERSTRLTMLVQVDSKKTSDVVGSWSKQLPQLPEGFKKILTWDRGTELVAHAELTFATGWTCSFVTLVVPSSEELTEKPMVFFDSVASKLNDRQRRTLKCHTPHHMLNIVLRWLDESIDAKNGGITKTIRVYLKKKILQWRWNVF